MQLITWICRRYLKKNNVETFLSEKISFSSHVCSLPASREVETYKAIDVVPVWRGVN